MKHGIWKFFKRSDFACKCGCGFQTLDVELADVILDLRLYFNDPAFINSGCRCPKHNKHERGSSKSKHMQGIAVDIRFQNIHADRIADYLEMKYLNQYGIGRYRGRTHMDVRPIKARWDNR